MLKAGFAQEIITPPIGVGLAGYANKRPNRGNYDELYVKVVAMERDGVKFGFVSFDLCNVAQALWDKLEKLIVDAYNREFYDSLIICTTHTHTGPEYRRNLDELALFALEETAQAAFRAIRRAFMNLQEATLESTSVYNNPYGFVRRYFMKNGTVITNPGWRNPDIDKPESDFDRTINVLAVKQHGRIAALLCNIANHGDTVGGDIVSADWFGHFAHEVQHELKSGLPVLVLDDCSGDINHFDFRQDIKQTSPAEAARIGRGYARIVLDALANLEPVADAEVSVKVGTVTIPHRKLTAEEVAAAQHVLDTVPDIPKEGDLESQDLANKVPAALRLFAQAALNCHAQSTPSHDGRLTAITIGKDLAFVSLPGEPFNGITRAIRERSPFKQTFVVTLAQSVSGYVPMRECFERGGYEVQPQINSVAPDAAEAIIDAAIKNLTK